MYNKPPIVQCFYKFLDFSTNTFASAPLLSLAITKYIILVQVGTNELSFRFHWTHIQTLIKDLITKLYPYHMMFLMNYVLVIFYSFETAILVIWIKWVGMVLILLVMKHNGDKTHDTVDEQNLVVNRRGFKIWQLFLSIIKYLT